MKTRRKHKPGNLRRYVPEANGNREDPKPVVVWIREPNARDRRMLAAFGDDYEVIGKPGGDEKDLQIRISAGDNVARQHYAIEQHVEKVDDYSADYVDDDDNVIETVEIVDGELLVAHGDNSIVTEVATEILIASQPTEDLEKKSGALLSGTKAETTRPVGNAKSANNPVLTNQETVTEQTQTLPM